MTNGKFKRKTHTRIQQGKEHVLVAIPQPISAGIKGRESIVASDVSFSGCHNATIYYVATYRDLKRLLY